MLDDPEAYFDQVIAIDLDRLEPHVVGPHSPDRATTVAGMSDHVKERGYPEKISVALIGSCTNSSYEDMGRVAAIAEQLADTASG